MQFIEICILEMYYLITWLNKFQISDFDSIGMLMWEISSGQPPFINFENDYYLAINIINGMRPKIVPETPLIHQKDLILLLFVIK
jgi:hypothetical protein